MRLPDSFSFRQKPSGAFRLILRTPVLLFRYRLGLLMGARFILVTHVGRRSGRRFQTPVEVVEQTKSGRTPARLRGCWR